MGGKMVEKMVVFAIVGKRNKSCEQARKQIRSNSVNFFANANNMHSLSVRTVVSCRLVAFSHLVRCPLYVLLQHQLLHKLYIYSPISSVLLIYEKNSFEVSKNLTT